MQNSFLGLCRQYYFKGKMPIVDGSFSLDVSDDLVVIALKYFEEGRYEEFSYYFIEYQYLINLWAAHIFLKYGNPPNKIKAQSLEIIGRYAESILNEEVAKEEKKWLSNSIENYDAD